MTDLLNKWVCTKPFDYMQINSGETFVCCPSWLTFDINDGVDGDYKRIFNNAKAQKIRESILDGSYRFCNHKVCPDLNAVKNGREPEDAFVPKESFTIQKEYDVETLSLCQDMSCNFQCPSCRTKLIPNNKDTHAEKQTIQDSAMQSFGHSIKRVIITGSGDPIYSKIYRRWLQTATAEKYPNLKHIQLVTNGKLLTEKMWNTFTCTDLISLIDIGVDAGTKYTYENVTRLGGDWQILLDNIKFLSELQDRDRKLIISYVVSKNNYTEMSEFCDTLEDIIPLDSTNRLSVWINFRQIVNWGTYSKEDMQELQIFEPQHKDFTVFISELKRIQGRRRVSHNFNHLLENTND